MLTRAAAVVAGIVGAGVAAAVLVAEFAFEPPAPAPAVDVGWAPRLADAPRLVPVSAFGIGPSRFEPNVGQAAASVRWLRRGPSHLTLLGETSFTTVVAPPSAAELGAVEPPAAHAVTFRFEGGSPAASSVGEGTLDCRTHYFVGAEPERWLRDVPNHARVRYDGVWPGIDVLFHGRDGRLEYDFLVAPGADAGRVSLLVEGADDVRVDASGDLVLDAGDARIRHLRPVVHEVEDDGRRRELPAAYVVDEAAPGVHRVRLRLDGRDPALALVVDPVEVVGFRTGGSLRDDGIAVAIAPATTSTFAIGGRTLSTDFTGPGALAGALSGSSDGFVAGYASSTAQFLAIVGSTADDGVSDLQIGGDGTHYVAGFTTNGATFPSNDPPQTGGLGGQDATLFALAPGGGSLTWSGPLGGSGAEIATSLALPEAAGAATATALWVGLETRSATIPGPGAAPGGGGDALVMRFSPAGDLTSSRYLGGAGDDTPGTLRVAWVPPGRVAVAYSTFSTGIPVSPDAYLTQPAGFLYGVVSLLSEDLATSTRSTFVAGSADYTVTTFGHVPSQGLFAVAAVESSGAIGTTGNAPQPTRPGIVNSHVTLLDADLTTATLRTYVGGDRITSIGGFASPPSTGTPELMIVGNTNGGFATAGGGDAFVGGSFDAFVAQLPVTGGAYSYVTHLGTSGLDRMELASGGAGMSGTAGRPVAVRPDGQILFLVTLDGPEADCPALGPALGGSDVALIASSTSAVLGPAAIPGLEVVRGSLADSPKALRDGLVLDLAWPATTTVPSLDLGGEGSVALRAVGIQGATGTATLLLADVPLDLAGWRERRPGELFTFASAKGVVPQVRLSVDVERRRVAASLSRLDFPFPPEPGPVVFELAFPSHAGTAESRIEAKPRGKGVLVDPLTGVHAELSVLTESPRAGEPLSLLARIENHDAAPAVVQVEFRLSGATVSTAAPTVPGRDPSTRLPGVVTVSAETVPETRGRPKAELFVDGSRADQTKIRVR